MLKTPAGRRAMALLCLVALTACMPSRGPVEPARPTIGQALDAPAADLGSSYLTAATASKMIEMVRAGMTIHTPEGTIDSSNVGRYAAAYAERLQTYAAAIEQRGYRQVAGVYAARASADCRGAGSSLPAATEVTIRQDGFRLELVQTITAGGQSAELTHPGVIVGSTLVAIDEIASDFEFLGAARPGEVELRPAVDHIRQTYGGYPPNFPPRPDWDALERCTISLVAR